MPPNCARFLRPARPGSLRGTPRLLAGRAAAIAGAVVLCFVRPAAAVEPPAPLHYDLLVDASVTAGALLGSSLLVAFQSELTPAHCRWCAPRPLDTQLRNDTLWANPQAADRTASLLGNLVIPLSMAGYLLLSACSFGDVTAGLVDVLLVVEAAAVTEVLTLAVKEISARERPWAYFGPNPGSQGPGANLSFYSAHTSFAFSTVAATTNDRPGGIGA